MLQTPRRVLFRRKLVRMPDAFTITRARLVQSPALVARLRQVVQAITDAEGMNTVGGRRFADPHQATRARRAAACRYVGSERAFAANPYRYGNSHDMPIRLDALVGIIQVGTVITTIRPVRCAVCGHLLPVGCPVAPHRAGVIGTPPTHTPCAPSRDDFFMWDPIAEALMLPEDREALRLRESPEAC